MNDHLKDPQAASWDDVKEELGFTEAEQAAISTGAQQLIAEARALTRSPRTSKHSVGS